MPVIPGPNPLPDGAWISAGDLLCDVTGIDPAIVDQVIVFASQSLNDLVGGRYPGPRTLTVWPGLDASCGCGAGRARVLPGSSLASAPSRRCGTPTDRVALEAPVRSIVEVLVDGATVDPAEYRVIDDRFLIGVGDRRWPACQRFDGTTLEGTMSVEYSTGNDPPAGGVISAGSLTCELLRMLELLGDMPCRLGKVTSVSRQGVAKTVASLDPASLFDTGLTGLAEVDLWISTTNGAPARAGGSFMDPARRRTHHRR